MSHDSAALDYGGAVRTVLQSLLLNLLCLDNI
jgi:hypothetical protein